MSTQIVHCSKCQTAIRWPAGASAARCPTCQNVIRQLQSEPAAAPAPKTVPGHGPPLAPASTTDGTNQRATPGTSAGGTLMLKCPGCKQTLKVGSGSAGKQVKCPHCAKVLRVPDGGGAGTAQPQPGQARRPHADAPLQRPAALQRPTSRPMMTQPSPQLAAVTWPAVPVAATHQPAFAGINPYQSPTFGSTATVPRPATGDFSSDIRLIKRVCWITFGLGFVPFLNAIVILLSILVAIIGGNVGAIWLLIRAFRIDTTQGLLVMFVPFYQVYFAVKNYGKVRDPALTMALSILPLCTVLVSSAIALGVMTLIQTMIN